MRHHLKQLLGDTAIYGISSIVTRMIGVFLVPIYARLLLPSEYGIIGLITTTFLLLNLVVSCALDNAVARWFFDTEEVEERKKLFSTWFSFYLLGTSVIALLMIMLSAQFAQVLIGSSEQFWLIIIPSITLVTNVLPNIITNWYRMQRKAKATITFTLSQSVCTILTTILFVGVFKWKLIGVLSALLLVSALFSVVAWVQMKGWLKFKRFDQHLLRELLKFSLPMIPAAIAYWLLNSTSAYFLNFFKDKTEVGLFNMGVMFASAISLFTIAFQQAWGPFAFSIMQEPNAKNVYAKVFLMYGYVMSLLGASLMLFAPELLRIFTTPQYYDAAFVAGIMGYNLIIIGFSYIASVATSVQKTTIPYSQGMIMATVISTILNIIFVPLWGKEGAAVAIVIGQSLVPMYLFYVGQKMYPIPYAFKEITMVLGLFAFIGVTGRNITTHSLMLDIALKIGLVVFMMSVLSLRNWQNIKHFYTLIQNKFST